MLCISVSTRTHPTLLQPKCHRIDQFQEVLLHAQLDQLVGTEGGQGGLALRVGRQIQLGSHFQKGVHGAENVGVEVLDALADDLLLPYRIAGLFKCRQNLSHLGNKRVAGVD